MMWNYTPIGIYRALPNESSPSPNFRLARAFADPFADGSWIRSDPAVGPGGDCGGDIQIGDAFDTRWTRLLPCGLYALVTRSMYVVEVDAEAAAFAASRFGVDVDNRYIEVQTEYLVCTDPDDPGYTEQWSDYTYAPVQAVLDLDVEVSDAGSELAAEHIDGPDDDEWNSAVDADGRTDNEYKI